MRGAGAYMIKGRACGAGPQLRERRQKAQRPCLGCSRMMLTTCASRLCRNCRLRAADFHGGVDEMQVLSPQMEQVEVDR